MSSSSSWPPPPPPPPAGGGASPSKANTSASASQKGLNSRARGSSGASAVPAQPLPPPPSPMMHQRVGTASHAPIAESLSSMRLGPQPSLASTNKPKERAPSVPQAPPPPSISANAFPPPPPLPAAQTTTATSVGLPPPPQLPPPPPNATAHPSAPPMRPLAGASYRPPPEPPSSVRTSVPPPPLYPPHPRAPSPRPSTAAAAAASPALPPPMPPPPSPRTPAFSPASTTPINGHPASPSSPTRRHHHHMIRPPPPPSNPADRPKIDPSQIPRPPLFTRPQNGLPVPIYYPRRTLQQQQQEEIRPPPEADSRFLTLDDGNAAPQLLRSTVYAMPIDRGVWRKAGSVPLGLISSPLAIASADHVPRPKRLPGDATDEQQQEEWRDPMRIPIETTTMGMPPPRCSHCAAYMNPFWGNDGRCNFCGARGAPASSGLCLQFGTVEYNVDGPYVTRKKPVEPIFLYALDATCPELKAYIPILQEVGVSLSRQFARQQQDQQQQGGMMLSSSSLTVSKPRIGCCLVGSFGVVIAYLWRDEIVLSVMSDVTEDPFCPLPLEEWTCDVSTREGLQQWMTLTQQLLETWKPFLATLDEPSSYGHSSFTLSCGGAALAFLADALAESGGRGTLLSWRRPNFGVGSIRDREEHNLHLYASEHIEHRLYTPLQLQSKLNPTDEVTASFYKKIGEECAKNRVCLDVILHTRLHPAAFLDVGTLSELCRITTGKLKWIRARDWQEPLLEELRRPVMCFWGSDAVFKVRCSKGIEVKSYMSTTAPGVTVDNVMSDSPELELSRVTPDTTIAVALEHKIGGLPQNSKMVYFQSALLYTTLSGQRRVRVTTLGLRTTLSVVSVFRSIDFLTLTAFLTRQAVAHVWESSDDTTSPLKRARDEINVQTIEMLGCYRRNTTAHALPPGQLILPDRLQLLPLFTNGILKSVLLRPSLPKRGSGYRATRPSPSADERAFGLHHGASSTTAMSMLSVHANMFSLMDLEDNAGEWQVPEQHSIATSEMDQASCHRYIQLPPSVPPSIACLEDDGVYLLDDGFSLYVYFGKDVGSDVISEFLSTDKQGCFISRETEVGQRVLRLIWQLRTFSSVGGGSESELRPTFAPVNVVLASDAHKDPYEEKIMNLMIDDATSSEQDYVEFLCVLHRRVRKKVELGTIALDGDG